MTKQEFQELTNEALVDELALAGESNRWEWIEAAKADVRARIAEKDAEITRLKIAMSTHDIGRDVAARSAAEKMRRACIEALARVNRRDAHWMRGFVPIRDALEALDIEEVLRGE